MDLGYIGPTGFWKNSKTLERHKHIFWKQSDSYERFITFSLLWWAYEKQTHLSSTDVQFLLLKSETWSWMMTLFKF